MFDFEEANEAIKKNEVMNIEAGGITVGQAAQLLGKKLDLAPLISRASNYLIEDEASASQARQEVKAARRVRRPRAHPRRSCPTVHRPCR